MKNKNSNLIINHIKTISIILFIIAYFYYSGLFFSSILPPTFCEAPLILVGIVWNIVMILMLSLFILFYFIIFKMIGDSQ